jgi:predicted small secreted protein
VRAGAPPASAAHKLRARMTAARRRFRAAGALAALVLAATALSACGKTHKAGEPVREGLSTPLGGLHYTVFLTRQLNLKDPEDSGYVPGVKEAAPGRGLFAVFIQGCNTGPHVKQAVGAGAFTIEDAEGDMFHPVNLPAARYPFLWHGGPVAGQNCEPMRGSLAQQGPTSGAIVLFNLPLAATENRPLTLHIRGPAGGTPPQAQVILDI